MDENKRDSIIFYRSFYEAISELPPEMQAKIYSAIFEYSLNFNEVVLEGLPKSIFTLIKPQLDANNKRFENGKKGGKKKGSANQEETKTEPNPNQTETETEPKTNQTQTKAEPNNNVNVNDNVNVNYNVLLEKETKEEISPLSDFENSELIETKNQKAKGQRKKVAQKKESEDDFELSIPEGFEELWTEWKDYRKDKKKKPYAGKKWEQKAIDDFFNIANEDPIIGRKILNQTITKNWEGLFKLKQDYDESSNNTAKPSYNSQRNTAGSFKVPGKITATSIIANARAAATTNNPESRIVAAEFEVCG